MSEPRPGQTVVIYTRGSEPPVARVYATAAEARAAIQRAEPAKIAISGLD